MASQATEHITADNPPDTLEEAVPKYDAALKECDAAIDRLESELAQQRERRMRLVSGREEACTALACKQSALKTAREVFAPQQDATGSSAAQPGRQLTIVPTDTPQAGGAPPTRPRTPEDGTSATAPHCPPDVAGGSRTDDQPEAPGSPDDEVIVRGARMKQILTAIAQRPEADWGTGDVAALLGIDERDIAARRALRENLRSLARRGALERVAVEGDFHTYYRPRMNWRFS